MPVCRDNGRLELAICPGSTKTTFIFFNSTSYTRDLCEVHIVVPAAPNLSGSLSRFRLPLARVHASNPSVQRIVRAVRLGISPVPRVTPASGSGMSPPHTCDVKPYSGAEGSHGAQRRR